MTVRIVRYLQINNFFIFLRFPSVSDCSRDLDENQKENSGQPAILIQSIEINADLKINK